MLLRHKKILLNQILSFLVLCIIFLPTLTLAQVNELQQFGNAAYGESAQYQETAGPVVIAGRIVNILLGIVGIIMVILFVYGGFLWMTAAGNEERISKAKTVLSRATIGFIILIMSYGIAYFVMQQVLKASGAPMTP